MHNLYIFLFRNNVSFLKAKHSVIFVNRKTIKLINNIIITPHEEITLAMFTFIGIFICAYDVIDIKISSHAIQKYIFSVWKNVTQFNEMYHAMERMQTDISGFH